MPVGRDLYLLRQELALFIYEMKADHRKSAISMNTMVDLQGSNWSCQLSYAREDLNDTLSQPPQSTLCITQTHLREKLLHGCHGSCLLRKILEKGGQQYKLQRHSCNCYPCSASSIIHPKFPSSSSIALADFGGLLCCMSQAFHSEVLIVNPGLFCYNRTREYSLCRLGATTNPPCPMV